VHEFVPYRIQHQLRNRGNIPYSWSAEPEYRIDIFQPQPAAGGAGVSQLVNGRDALKQFLRDTAWQSADNTDIILLKLDEEHSVEVRDVTFYGDGVPKFCLQ
jgi:hypothetical protein